MAAPQRPLERVLEIDRIAVVYGTTVAVHDASLTVGDGEFVVVTGSNGSGKSSLVRSVLGFVPLRRGSIRLDGAEADTRRLWHRRRQLVAYVPQRTSPGSFPLLVRELLSSSGAEPEALTAAAQLGIADVVDRPLSTLSGGQLQRAYLARAMGSLIRHRVLLLADEPTSALDFEGQEQVAELLHGLECDRLVVSHDAAVVRRADRVMEMAGGVLRSRA